MTVPYDPRRSRPTPKVVPDEESAPIDALLGPSPEPESEPEQAALSVVPHAADAEPDADESVEAPAATEAPAVEPPAPTSLPTPVRKAERAPSPVLQLAPLLIAGALALIWLIRRRRR